MPSVELVDSGTGLEISKLYALYLKPLVPQLVWVPRNEEHHIQISTSLHSWASFQAIQEDPTLDLLGLAWIVWKS